MKSRVLGETWIRMVGHLNRRAVRLGRCPLYPPAPFSHQEGKGSKDAAIAAPLLRSLRSTPFPPRGGKGQGIEGASAARDYSATQIPRWAASAAAAMAFKVAKNAGDCPMNNPSAVKALT